MSVRAEKVERMEGARCTLCGKLYQEAVPCQQCGIDDVGPTVTPASFATFPIIALIIALIILC